MLSPHGSLEQAMRERNPIIYIYDGTYAFIYFSSNAFTAPPNLKVTPFFVLIIFFVDIIRLIFTWSIGPHVLVILRSCQRLVFGPVGDLQTYTQYQYHCVV